MAGQTRGADRVVLELPAGRQAGLVTFSFKRKSDKQEFEIKLSSKNITDSQES